MAKSTATLTDNEKLTGENQVYSQQFVLLQTELQEATGDKKRLDLRLAHLQGELLVIPNLGIMRSIDSERMLFHRLCAKV